MTDVTMPNIQDFLKDCGNIDQFVDHDSASPSDPKKRHGLDYVLECIRAGISSGQRELPLPLKRLLDSQTLEYEQGKYLIFGTEGQYVAAVELQKEAIGVMVLGVWEDGQRYVSAMRILAGKAANLILPRPIAQLDGLLGQRERVGVSERVYAKLNAQLGILGLS